MLEFENKLNDVGKKVDRVETQLNRVEANQDGIKTQNQSILKLVAAIHVKIDTAGNHARPPLMRQKDISPEVQIFLDSLPVVTEKNFDAFLHAYKNKIEVKDALVKISLNTNLKHFVSICISFYA